ncbi:MAG: cupin domain-containing protein, partial [Gammaproteobacteria bacterium]
ISMAWVRLEAGERLDEHIHPVDSMILLCEGSAGTLGDVRDVMNAGDVLLVPQGRPHGFIGMPPNGFWGLSLQFDSRGLYEDIADPWATFAPEDGPAGAPQESIAEQLFRKNEEYMERFDKHRLFALVRAGLLNNPESKKRFLDCFQVWSNHFQKMVLARVMTLQHPKFEELAWLHLSEELGHNRDLAKNRDDLHPVFDPVLEAACAWFPWKTALISDADKVVLTHLVVEASATYFYKHIQPAMAASGTAEHFDTHKVDDDGHVEMGYAFLRQLDLQDPQQLFEIQRQGWAMLTTVMGRIADLVVHHSAPSGGDNTPGDQRDADELLAA